MLELHRKMLLNYYGIIKANYNKETFNKDVLLNPPSYIFEQAKKALYKLILSTATDTANIELGIYQSCEESEEEMEEYEKESLTEKEAVISQINIIRAGLIYVDVFPSTDGNEFISYINKNSITTVLDRINSDSDFEDKVILYFLRYLVAKSEAWISSEKENRVILENKLIENLSYNKGMVSITDLAMQAFIDLYEDLIEVNGYTEKVWNVLDNFIISNACNNYLEQNGIDTQDTNNLKIIKKMLVRAILSDAYINLKCTKAQMQDLEIDMLTPEDEIALKYIEKAIESGNYLLPKDKDIRQIIYQNAILYTSEILPYRDMDFESLDEETKEHVLTIDPFRQMGQ